MRRATNGSPVHAVFVLGEAQPQVPKIASLCSKMNSLQFPVIIGNKSASRATSLACALSHFSELVTPDKVVIKACPAFKILTNLGGYRKNKQND
jgi:hypothetical protein